MAVFDMATGLLKGEARRIRFGGIKCDGLRATPKWGMYRAFTNAEVAMVTEVVIL